MESGQGSLVELRSTIGAVDAQAFVRVAVEVGSQAVWHVDAIVSPPSVPAGWQPLVWRYEHVTFIAAQVSVKSLVAALSIEAPQVLSVAGHDVVLPSLSDQFTWQRKPSRARFDSMVLPWPTYICSLREPNSQQRQAPQGYLIGAIARPSRATTMPSGHSSTGISRGRQVGRCHQNSRSCAW